ncbi:MAG: hypothetical protein L0I62_09170 [Gammaproteobacteria bacterium]|nr:hypothetical protein [Gammaproteobacteria bacterium]
MKMKIILPVIVAGAVLALAACASQPQNGQSNQSKTMADNPHTYVVCNKYPTLGSHIAQVNCVKMSSAQYEAYKKAKAKQAEKDRKALEALQNRGNIGGGPGA